MSSPSTANIEHRVNPGETFSGIARQHGVTVDILLASNPDIKDANLVRVGQIVIIPGPPAPAGEPTNSADSPRSTSTTSSTTGSSAPVGSTADLNAILSEAESNGASDATAKQDGLPARGIHRVAASEAMAQTDRKRVIQHKAKFIEAARQFSLPPALLAAIASRESRGGSVLKNGFGDGGHGFGLMQVYDRSHSPVQTGGPTGQPHINQATGILKDKLLGVQRALPQLSAAEQLQTAVSRYNGGAGLAAPNSDRGTTGGDYMNDVWARARFYARVEQWG